MKRACAGTKESDCQTKVVIALSIAYPAAVSAGNNNPNNSVHQATGTSNPRPSGHATAHVQDSTDNDRTEYTANISNPSEWTAKVAPLHRGCPEADVPGGRLTSSNPGIRKRRKPVQANGRAIVSDPDKTDKNGEYGRPRQRKGDRRYRPNRDAISLPRNFHLYREEP